jgi:hypothetical protein
MKQEPIAREFCRCIISLRVLFLRDGVKESTSVCQQVIHTGITRTNDVKYAVAY